MFKTELTNLQNESPTSLHLALTQWLSTLDRTGYQLAGQKFCPRVRAIGARYRLAEGFHFLSGCHAYEVLLVALRTFNHQINALRHSVLHASTSISKLGLTFRVALYPSYLISASASDDHQEQNAAQSDQGRRGVFLDSVPTLEPTNLPRIVQSSSSFINRGDNHRNPVPIQNGTVLVGTFVILFR
jgi:hypothetical protein